METTVQMVSELKKQFPLLLCWGLSIDKMPTPPFDGSILKLSENITGWENDFTTLLKEFVEKNP
jgi:hypothetical protein